MSRAAPWDDLTRELDEWGEAGLNAAFWWRDDDAVTATAELERLLEIGREFDVPVGLAVIPANADGALAETVARFASVTVLQHGYAHQNYAPPTEKKTELGRHRPAPVVVGELATGWAHLDRLFGGSAIPVMVPPWNRIAPHLVPMLPELRYYGVSTYGCRKRQELVAGLRQVNTHLDVIDWPRTRGFAGAEAVLELAVAHLRAKREKTADADEPTGLLSHHLVHDEASWDFIGTFLDCTTKHAAAHWLGPARLFGARAPPGTGH